MIRQLIMVSLLSGVLFACGDKEKDILETADTSETGDSYIETGDSGEKECELPTFVPDGAYTWAGSTPYGGYSLTATNGRAYIGDPVSGSVLGIPWGQPSGFLETSYDLILTGTPYSTDKLTRSGDWLGVSDAARLDRLGNMTGAVFIMPAEGVDHLTGAVPAEAAAVITLLGYRDTGYTSALWIADVYGNDGLPDAITQSGPLPGELAVFSDVNAMSGEYEWYNASLVLDACEKTGRVIYAPVSMTVFGNGSGSGFLAAGCPGNDYRGGEAWVWELPLDSFSTPATIITNVSGWYVASEGLGFPLFLDGRHDSMVGVISDADSEEPVGSSITFSSGNWWGSSPITMTSPDGECGALVVGEPSATNKGEETGAVWAIALDALGFPIGEWQSLSIRSSESSPPKWIGSVLASSQDGTRLAVSGWQENSRMGGGMVTYEVRWTSSD